MLQDYTYPKKWEQHAFPKEAFNDEYREVKNTLEAYRFERYEFSNFARN